MPPGTMKVALVTASSKGLGRAIAKMFARDMKVVINYNSSPDQAALVKAEMMQMAGASEDQDGGDSAGARFAVIKADLGNRAELEHLVNETIRIMGRLDIVVSSGGWTRVRTFTDLDDNVDEDDWDQCFSINVKHHLHLLHLARRYLEETKGSFTTVASTAGVKPSGSSIAYSVTKAAQIHMVKCLAQAVGPNIRVNSVSPGFLMTDWTKEFPEEMLRGIREGNPLEKFATVEDVADAVRMLALNSSITGHNMIVDAGFCV